MTDASRLDRLISYLSPTRGARRLAARRMIAALSYEGARIGRREKGWITGTGTSANAEITGDRLTLRARARALRRDNPYAKKAVAALVTNRIGTGILATPASNNKSLNKKLKESWKRWIDRCDYAGKTDLYGIQTLAEMVRIESGEALVRFVPLRSTETGDVPLRLQVLEPDFLDTTRYEQTSKTSRTIGGIDFIDRRETIEGIEYLNGVPAAYWLYPSHPGDNAPLLRRSLESQRIPASEILHYFRVERAGQRTGVTELAPVIRRLYDLDGYADAELMRKRIAACSVGWVTTPGDLPGVSLGPTSTAQDASGNTRREERMSPGMFYYGKPGESAEFFDPKPSGDYRDFFGVELHAVAAGLNMPFEILTGDLAEVNYSSLRGGMVQFKADVESDQWQMIVPQLCQPIWDRFVRDAEARPGLRVPAVYSPPHFELLDPAKEIPPQIEAVQGGLTSLSATIRGQGENPEEVFDEIAAERLALSERGLNNLTSINPSAGKAGAAAA